MGCRPLPEIVMSFGMLKGIPSYPVDAIDRAKVRVKWQRRVKKIARFLLKLMASFTSV